MAIFADDFQALLFVIILGAALYIGNRFGAYIIEKIKKIPVKNKNKVTFAIRIISILVLLYYIIEGFPSFTSLPTEYTAVVSSAVSIVVAFAASGIFSNLIAGILIWIVDPIDIGDIVKIKDHKGVIKSMTLTKVIIETFDGIIVEIINSDVATLLIVNYTTNLEYRKKYFYFKKQIRSPQNIGIARIDIDVYDEEKRKKEENDLKQLFDKVSERNKSKIYAYTFAMQIPFEQFRIRVNKMKKVCEKYTETFGYPPSFHIVNFSYEIFVKFRIISLDWRVLFQHQPQFTMDLYKAILG